MEPLTISASAVETFEGCEARYNAEYILKAPQPGGNAAQLGTAVHGALERFIVDEMHLAEGTLADLHALYEEEWWKVFDTKHPHMYDEGKTMLATWFNRQNWEGREVLMAEVKERFPLTIPGRDEPLLVTYIWDRCDRRPDGAIHVIDYKSYGQPLPVDVLKERIQPRLYALAAFIRFKAEEPKYIWVSYDMLRYEEIGMRFTREECIETWNYLQKVAARIYASDGTPENLNPTCRWCVRQGACETLHAHASVGGMLGINTLEEAIDRRATADAAAKALYGQRDDLDSFILEQFEERMLDPREGYAGETAIAKIKAKKTRVFPRDKVAEILGPELMAKIGKLGVTQLDDLMKTDDLTADQKAKIKGLITQQLGNPYIETKPLSEFTD